MKLTIINIAYTKQHNAAAHREPDLLAIRLLHAELGVNLILNNQSDDRNMQQRRLYVPLIADSHHHSLMVPSGIE